MRLISTALIALLFQAEAQEVPPRAEAVDPTAAPVPAVQVEPDAGAGLDPDADPAIAVSRTRQFLVSGGDFALRGSVAILAEEVKSDLLSLTEDTKYAWKIPIGIQLHGAPGEPLPARTTALSIFFGDACYQIHIDAHVGRGINRSDFLRAIMAALVHERALHSRHPDDTPFSVPPWLVEGLLEANAWRLGNGDRKLYETLVASGGLFGPNDLFDLDARGHEALDAVMRAAFRVSAGALVMALIGQPQGIDGTRDFLAEVAAFQGEMPILLRRHFPELNLSGTSLAKWLALQLAAKGAAPTTDVLSVAETDAALTEALVVHLRDPDGNLVRTSVDAAWGVFPTLEPPARVEALRFPQDALTRLSHRCFPSHRPLIAEYLDLVAELHKGAAKDAEVRFGELAAKRATMLDMATRASDYLDWFEITRARETSGAFDDFLKLKERLKHPPYPRQDPVSDYLDRMDHLFHRDPSGR